MKARSANLPQYVITVRDRTSVRFYFWRRPGPRIRLRDEPGTPAFQAEYERLLAAPPPPKPDVVTGPAQGSVRWLVTRYYRSPAFKALDPTTRRTRSRILDRICERIGTVPFKKLEPKHIAQLRDKKADHPEAANAIVKSLRQIFRWACLPEYALATVNPAREVGYLKPLNPDGHETWVETDAQRFEARWPLGTKQRLLFDILVYLGVRISDAALIGPQMERDGILHFTEFKGRDKTPKKHAARILEPLARSIAAYRATNPVDASHLVYLITEHGEPYSIKGLGQYFARACRLAKMRPGLSAHGIRKFGAVRAAEAGATEQELMALFGWTNSRQAVLYTRKANRERLEQGAAEKLYRTPFEPGPPAAENVERLVTTAGVVTANVTANVTAKNKSTKSMP